MSHCWQLLPSEDNRSVRVLSKIPQSTESRTLPLLTLVMM
jgi:hypothetical protein